MSGKSESTTSLLPKSDKGTIPTSSTTSGQKNDGTGNSTPKKTTPTNSSSNSPTSDSHVEFGKKAKESGWGSTTPTGASLGA
ncbi:hypothetical protein D9758_017728 [Tetrapyrgos nigripes]|uniref:Uncharacterized protein n=1 Tax=Tetrapyrgos nigripes TaxID=182062 RepID=A0A8H5F9E7_9AGAR|nr:hypothetical protein D9758_017728 [Tetrapyrgos nigripes]